MQFNNESNSIIAGNLSTGTSIPTSADYATTNYKAGISPNSFTSTTLTKALSALTVYAANHTTWLNTYGNHSEYYVTLHYSVSGSAKASLYTYDASTKTWNELTSIVAIKGDSANDVEIEYSINGTVWLSDPTSSTMYLRVSTDGGTTWSDAILYKGSDGSDGTSVTVQYSSDGTNWHLDATSDDLYIRVSDDDGETWDVLTSRVDSNNTIVVQFSVDGSTSWHSTATDDDLYWRWSYDNGNSWTAAVLFRGTNTTSLSIEYSVDGSTDWHENLTDADVYWRWSIDDGTTWSDAAPFKTTNGSGIGIPSPYGYTIDDDGQLIITLDGEPVAYIGDAGSWFAESLTTGVGSLHLGELHAIGSAGQNVVFRNEETNLIYSPLWEVINEDGSDVTHGKIRLYGEQYSATHYGAVDLTGTPVGLAFDYTFPNNMVCSVMKFYPSADYTGTLVFTSKTDIGLEIHRFTYKDVTLTADTEYTMIFKYSIWVDSGDYLSASLVDGDGNEILVRPATDDPTKGYREVLCRDFTEHNIYNAGETAAVASDLNALTGDDRLDAASLKNLTLNDTATSSSEGIVTLSTQTPGTTSSAGTSGTANGIVANADHSHPFGLQPVTKGGTGLTTIPMGSLLYASVADTLSVLTPGNDGVLTYASSAWAVTTPSGTGTPVYSQSPTLVTPTIGSIKFSQAAGISGQALIIGSDNETVIYGTPKANATFVQGKQITIDSLVTGNILVYNETTSAWENQAVTDSVTASSVGGIALDLPTSPVANSYFVYDGSNFTLTTHALANASRIQGVEVDNTDIGNEKVPAYDNDTSKLLYKSLSELSQFSAATTRISDIENRLYEKWYRTASFYIASGATADTTKTVLPFVGIPETDFSWYAYYPAGNLTFGVRFNYTDSTPYYVGSIFNVSANDAASDTPVNADSVSALFLADAAGDYDTFESVQAYVRSHGFLFFIPGLSGTTGMVDADHPAYLVEFAIVRSGDITAAGDRFEIFANTIKIDSDWSGFQQVIYS